MADKITIKHRYTNAVLFEYTPTDEQQASGQRKPATPGDVREAPGNRGKA